MRTTHRLVTEIAEVFLLLHQALVFAMAKPVGGFPTVVCNPFWMPAPVVCVLGAYALYRMFGGNPLTWLPVSGALQMTPFSALGDNAFLVPLKPLRLVRSPSFGVASTLVVPKVLTAATDADDRCAFVTIRGRENQLCAAEFTGPVSGFIFHPLYFTTPHTRLTDAAGTGPSKRIESAWQDTCRKLKNAYLPSTPGEILRAEFMEPLQIGMNRLALDLHVPVTRIAEIVHERRGITPDTALRLARYFQTSGRFWLNLQTAYDLEVAEDELSRNIERQVQPSPSIAAARS